MTLNIQIKETLEEEEYLFLKNRWVTFAANLKISTERRWQIFEIITQRYSESHRAYHNLVHLYSLFRVLDQYFKPQNVHVEAAIWFHDIIYTIGHKNNELDSAHQAVELLAEYLEGESLEMIQKLIESTQKHLPVFQDGVAGQLNRILLDIDLSVLGTDWTIYQQYTQAIRKEYNVFSDEAFQQGRKLVMEKFLERPTLYYTKAFQTLLEAKARANIQKEILAIN